MSRGGKSRKGKQNPGGMRRGQERCSLSTGDPCLSVGGSASIFARWVPTNSSGRIGRQMFLAWYIVRQCRWCHRERIEASGGPPFPDRQRQAFGRRRARLFDRIERLVGAKKKKNAKKSRVSGTYASLNRRPIQSNQNDAAL